MYKQKLKISFVFGVLGVKGLGDYSIVETKRRLGNLFRNQSRFRCKGLGFGFWGCLIPTIYESFLQQKEKSISF